MLGGFKNFTPIKIIGFKKLGQSSLRCGTCF